MYDEDLVFSLESVSIKSDKLYPILIPEQNILIQLSVVIVIDRHIYKKKVIKMREIDDVWVYYS